MAEFAAPSYLQFTNQLGKSPIFYVVFGTIQSTELLSKNTSSNPNIALPQEFASAPIRNATKSRPNILTVPSSVTQQINPLLGTVTVGSTQFNLTDKNDIITNLIHNYVMKNRSVTIYGGYQEINEDEFRPLFTGIITDIQMQNNTADYVFYVSDYNRYLHTGSTGSLFDATTSLFKTLQVNDTIAYTYGTNAFAPATDLDRYLPPSVLIDSQGNQQVASGIRLPVHNFIRIDDEIMGYTGVTSPATVNGQFQPGSFTGLIRGEDLSAWFPGYNVQAARVNHDAGATINNFVQIGPINPVDLSLMIMTSNYGNGGNGVYDLLGWEPKPNVIPSGLNDQCQGCALPQEFIDTSGYLAQRNQWFSDDRMLFFIERPVKASDFLSKEIYTYLNAFPYVKMNGQLSLAVYGNGTAPPGETLYVFNDTNTVPNTLQWAANLQTNQGIYNAIEVDYDYDNILDSQLTINYNYDAPSINATGEMAQIKQPSAGLRGGLNGDALVQRYSRNIFRRYGFGAQKITFNSFYTGHLVDPGDFVLIEMTPLPNMRTGTRGGIPYVCQIVQKNINFQSGQIQFVALTNGVVAQVGLPGSNSTTSNSTPVKGSFITPTSALNGGTFPVYTSGTISQQRSGYAFISISGTPVPLQTNGDIGSFIM